MDGAFANPAHWIFAIIVLVLVFGANKLGDVGGALGKSVREFKKATHEDDAAQTPLVAVASSSTAASPSMPQEYPPVGSESQPPSTLAMSAAPASSRPAPPDYRPVPAVNSTAAAPPPGRAP